MNSIDSVRRPRMRQACQALSSCQAAQPHDMHDHDGDAVMHYDYQINRTVVELTRLKSTKYYQHALFIKTHCAYPHSPSSVALDTESITNHAR